MSRYAAESSAGAFYGLRVWALRSLSDEEWTVIATEMALIFKIAEKEACEGRFGVTLAYSKFVGGDGGDVGPDIRYVPAKILSAIATLISNDAGSYPSASLEDDGSWVSLSLAWGAGESRENVDIMYVDKPSLPEVATAS